MAENFSLIKFLKGFIPGLSWIKAISLGSIFCIVLALGNAVYKTYIKPPQTQTVIAGEGSIVNLNQTKDNWIDPFIEAYAFAETDNRYGGGIRCGIRF